MNPGLVVKLRPAGPWRIGPDSGARNRVDTIYHSDSLYSAVTAAMARLGSLDEWLDATARSGAPSVSFGSCFPFLDEIGFVVPPRTLWPPTSPALMGAHVRWKSARFVPLGIVQALLAGEKLDDNQWAVDGPSECLVPAGRPGPFRIGMRWNAAVDRMTGTTERHSTACIEFRPGAGLWTVVAFVDEAARERWIGPLKAAFRLLADTGFGGERSRGWGRSEAPEFVEGTLPEMILGEQKARATARVRGTAAPIAMAGPRATAGTEETAPAVETVTAVPEPVTAPEVATAAAEETAPAVEAVTAAPEETAPAVEAVTATPEPVTEPEVVSAVSEAVTVAAEETAPAVEAVIATPEPVTGPEAVSAVSETVTVAAEEMAPAVEAVVATPEPVTAPEVASAVSEAVTVTPEGATPAVEAVTATPEPVTGPEVVSAVSEAVTVAPEETAPAVEAVTAAPEPVTGPEATEPAATAEPEGPPAVSEAAAPAADAHPAATPPPVAIAGAHAHWMLSLFTPGAQDTVDWTRGNYTVLARGGRVESPAGSGELKKTVQMLAEGSVVYATAAPHGSAPNVAPDGFAHPVFRAGFAVAIPLPEVS